MSSSLPKTTQNTYSPQPNSVRKDGCTHYQMTRLYDPAKLYHCDLCHEQPKIGWLYRCTQATDGSLPLSDFAFANTSRSHHLSDLEDEGSFLEYPAQNNHEMYMLEEADDELTEALEQSTISGADSTQVSADPSDLLTTCSTFPTSPSMSTRSSISMNTNPRQSSDSDALGTSIFEKTVDSDLHHRPGIDITRKSHPSTDAILDPPCTFKVCSGCRPVFRERAYQSIDKILNDPMARVPAWEFYNRPVSNARVVARLGLTKPKHTRKYELPPPYEPSNTMSTFSHHAIGRESDQASTQLLSDALRHSMRRRSEFRKTVQTALRRARSADADTRAPWTRKEFKGLGKENKDENDDEDDVLYLPATTYQRRPLPPLPTNRRDHSANISRREAPTFPSITVTAPANDQYAFCNRTKVSAVVNDDDMELD